MDDESYFPEKSIPDLELSVENRRSISRLTPTDVARIDNWLMSFAIRRGRKVSYLAMQSMSQLESDLPDVPDAFYILRVQKLIEEKRLIVSLGEIEDWPGCEVCLPKGEIEWK